MARTGSASGRFQLMLAVVLLLVLVTFIVIQGEEEAPQPFDPASTAPTGLRALWLWLEALEYTVVRNDGATFAIPDDCAVIFVFPNQQPYTTKEAYQLKHWVAAGGTLVLVGPARSGSSGCCCAASTNSSRMLAPVSTRNASPSA